MAFVEEKAYSWSSSKNLLEFPEWQEWDGPWQSWEESIVAQASLIFTM